MNHGLEIRNLATSKCLLVHALTHPAEKNAQPTGMNFSDRLDNSSGSKQTCDFMELTESVACKPILKKKSTQGLNQALWPSLVPSSPRALSGGWIGKREINRLLKKAAKSLPPA